MSVNKKKVVIVGGSASGFLCSLLLAERGHEVTVLERADSIDPAARTLIVTGRMRDYTGSLTDRAVVNEINRFELFANGHVATAPLATPDLIVQRSEVIRSLAQASEKAGVHIRLGRSFVDMESTTEGMKVHFRTKGSQEMEVADVVIGADGASSRVAAAGGWPRQPRVPLLQAIVDMPEDMLVDSSRVWFRPKVTPYFFWMIPEGDGRAGLGVIGERPNEVRSLMDAFLAEKGFTAHEFQLAMIPRYSRWTKVHRKVGHSDVYLVGDAAGQVKVSTVGGIVTGFRGAVGVVEAIEKGRSPELRRLRRDLDMHLLISKILHRFTEADYIRLLSLIDADLEQALGGRTRDESPRLVFDVLKAKPSLALFALKLGMRGLTPAPAPLGS